MEIAIELTTRAGTLLLVIAFCRAIAQRLRLSDSFVLTGAGASLGFGQFFALQHVAPHYAATTIAPFLSPALLSGSLSLGISSSGPVPGSHGSGDHRISRDDRADPAAGDRRSAGSQR
ncbi:hypothetical protein ACTMU2_11110 [Cupriavidus basilensis]